MLENAAPDYNASAPVPVPASASTSTTPATPVTLHVTRQD